MNTASKFTETRPREARTEDLDALYASGGALKLWNDKEASRIRAQEEGTFYHQILHKAGAKKVLDTASAAGFHAISLAKADFDMVAIDGLPEFVQAGIQNQSVTNTSFPFRTLRWSEINARSLPENPFDAALCLGGSLHHTNQVGIAELFSNVKAVLRPKGLFIVEQRNYERLFDERPKSASHPCGWSYTLDYVEPRTLYFHLLDIHRDINVRFEGLITFENELLALAKERGFELLETYFDHGRTSKREKSNWVEYVFRAI